MATSLTQDVKAVSISNVDLLLHPELLSQEFMQLILNEKRICTSDCCSRDRLSELYLRHVIPLPQRTLPSSRWGKRMARRRGRQTPAGARSDSSNNDHKRKRPLIVFDGSSSLSGPIKVKKPEGTTVSPEITNRLKPPPTANLPHPICKLSGNTSSSSSSSSSSLCLSTDQGTNLKRESNTSVAMKSPDVKKKIQHVTWP
ncbi:ashwin-like [Brachionichthys hirsutus]|uniref:ashwin-like n=1 Tax=Brachionichthys hirsutus TaxID=412623 RepID=UPI003604889F